jgi:hypothetical protein
MYGTSNVKMRNPMSILVTPIALLSFLPLLCFALLTTALALGVLYIKALAVYLELGSVLLQNYVFSKNPSPPNKKEISPAVTPTRKRRKSRSSTHSSNSDLSSHGIEQFRSGYPYSLGYQRDFESVGGYRFFDDVEEETTWTNLNSSLELPSPMSRRHHTRSMTAQGLPTTKGTRSPRQSRLGRGNSAASLSTLTANSGQSVALRSASNESGSHIRGSEPKAGFDNSKPFTQQNVSSSSTVSSANSGRSPVLSMRRSALE